MKREQDMHHSHRLCFTPAAPLRPTSYPSASTKHRCTAPCIRPAYHRSPRACAQTAPTTPILTPNPDHYEHSLSHPTAHRYITEDGSSYALWYTAAPDNTATPPTSVSLAISDDGRTFSRVAGPLDSGAVLGPNAEDWWSFDTNAVSVGSVVVSSATRVRADAAVFYLYYHARAADAIDGSPLPDDPLWRIGVAVSKDGEHFSRIEGDFPSGAVLEPADIGFDSGAVAAPSVLQLARPSRPAGLAAMLAAQTGSGGSSSGLDSLGGGRGAVQQQYIMHFHGRSAASPVCAIGRAVSDDGLKFRREPDGEPVVPRAGAEVPAFAAGGVRSPHVLHRDTADASAPFVMFVEAEDAEGVRCIAACESTDCENWGELSVALQAGPTGAWDAGGVGQPSVVEEASGAVRLFYIGWGTDGQAGSAIGVAVSGGSDWRTMQRMDGMSMGESA